MEAGNSNHKHSVIWLAIVTAEKGTTGEIRVHLSRRFFERNPYARATRLFHRFGMERTTHRNSVLLYVNMARRKFAIVGDEGIHRVVGQEYWDTVARRLAQHLRETHPENAIARAVLDIGETLRKFFPLEAGTKHQNEVPDDVTEG